MVEIAKVIEVKDNFARLEIMRQGSGNDCATFMLANKIHMTYIEAINRIGAKKGDFVELELSSKTFFTAVMMIYGLPLIMLIIGIFTGSTLLQNFGITVDGNLAGIVLGVSLMALSYLIASINDKKYKQNKKVNFEMKRLVKMQDMY